MTEIEILEAIACRPRRMRSKHEILPAEGSRTREAVDWLAENPSATIRSAAVKFGLHYQELAYQVRRIRKAYAKVLEHEQRLAQMKDQGILLEVAG